MKLAILLVLISVSPLSGSAQNANINGAQKSALGPPAMCEAAASKLRDSGTNQVVLTMTVDAQGKVQSFKTEAPKGLRLEKVKKATTEIKAMRFDPALKNGKPVMAMISAAFECSDPDPASHAAKH
jgi:hypothetical protein